MVMKGKDLHARYSGSASKDKKIRVMEEEYYRELIEIKKKLSKSRPGDLCVFLFYPDGNTSFEERCSLVFELGIDIDKLIDWMEGRTGYCISNHGRELLIDHYEEWKDKKTKQVR